MQIKTINEAIRNTLRKHNIPEEMINLYCREQSFPKSTHADVSIYFDTDSTKVK